MKKVLILGGGFAGVQAAIELQKKKIFDVTLVSNRDYLYLFPISIWIPTHKKQFDDVKVQLADIQKIHKFNVIIDAVQQINSKQNEVVLQNQKLTYDYLIVALGAQKVKHQGIENTISICGEPESAIAIREKLDKLIAKGSGTITMGFGGNPKDKSAVRGGPAFELMFNVHNYLKQKNIRNNFELTFFAPMEQPGAKMGESALKMMDKMFDKLKIAKHFGKKITNFQADGIEFEDGSKLASDLIMFIAAGAGHSIFQNSDLPLSEAGFVKIDDNCLVHETQNVYAIGDSAALEGPDWVAKQGHIAELMARNTVFNIYNSEIGKPERKEYQAHLNIICVMDMGNGAAFVFRNSKRAFLIPMPIIGHWMKLGWGKYAAWTKLGKFPRIPGM
jgi:sulfide:quinone oxidoreductase